MPKITNQQLYTEIKGLTIVLLGVPDSDDKGLYGECREMKKLLKEINGKARTSSAWIGAFKWMVGFLFLGVLALITGKIGMW